MVCYVCTCDVASIRYDHDHLLCWFFITIWAWYFLPQFEVNRLMMNCVTHRFQLWAWIFLLGFDMCREILWEFYSVAQSAFWDYIVVYYQATFYLCVTKNFCDVGVKMFNFKYVICLCMFVCLCVVCVCCKFTAIWTCLLCTLLLYTFQFFCIFIVAIIRLFGRWVTNQ